MSVFSETGEHLLRQLEAGNANIERLCMMAKEAVADRRMTVSDTDLLIGKLAHAFAAQKRLKQQLEAQGGESILRGQPDLFP